MPGVVPPQVQDPALALIELHEVPLCPTLQPVQVSLNGSTACQCIQHTSQFCVISKLAEGIKGSKGNIAPKINPTGDRGRRLVKQFTASPVTQNILVTPSNKTM